jgi:hypothetical protein
LHEQRSLLGDVHAWRRAPQAAKAHIRRHRLDLDAHQRAAAPASLQRRLLCDVDALQSPRKATSTSSLSPLIAFATAGLQMGQRQRQA